MAVKIRLKRVGMRNSPVHRIVVADGRSPRDGRNIEELGTYWPLQRGADNFKLDLERAEYWLGVGARPSDTVRSIIRKARRTAQGLALPEAKPKKKAAPLKEEVKEEAPAAEEAPTEEVAVEEPKADASAEESATSETASEEVPSDEEKPEKPAAEEEKAEAASAGDDSGAEEASDLGEAASADAEVEAEKPVAEDAPAEGEEGKKSAE